MNKLDSILIIIVFLLFLILPLKKAKAKDIYYLMPQHIEEKRVPEFNDIIQGLMEAKKTDKVILLIRGKGGSVPIALEVINAIKNTKADLRCVVSGSTASAHTMIVLSCPIEKTILFPKTTHLLHISRSCSVLNPDLCWPNPRHPANKITSRVLTKSEFKFISEDIKHKYIFPTEKLIKRWNKYHKTLILKE